MLNFFVLACLACVLCVQCSVLVPTYVLPPSSFVKATRDQRSLAVTRTLARLAGGHIKLHNIANNGSKEANKVQPDGNHGKNTFAYIEKDPKNYEDKEKKHYDEKDVKYGVKDVKNYDEKFAGVVVKQEGQSVGWNQGQWDDGMLMSSAGNGKEKKQKTEVDEDKKTLADQVKEGKYGLIQKELFLKTPTRPGVISYNPNPETEAQDNESNLGGLKNSEIWLSEDHLLVLRGGSYPDHGSRHGTDGEAWAPLDNYQAPPRQVKLPANPEVPPPFPVRLSDGGPLVFLTPNGSIPALPPGAGYGGVPPQGFPYPPSAASYPPKGAYPGNAPPGGAPFPFAPFPFLSGNGSGPFPFPSPLTDGPPGAFLPPPGNLSDLYDEDDPANYYPPPYSFVYTPDNTSAVPPGPLVPGIVLPPPPDFFGPLEPEVPSTSARPTAHVYPPTSGAPPTAVLQPKPPKRPAHAYLPLPKPESALPETPDNSIEISTVPPTKTITITSRPIKKPNKVVFIPKPNPPRKVYSTTPAAIRPSTVTTTKLVEKKRPAVTILHKPIKTTLKPVSGGLYDYPEKNNYLENNSVSPSPQPFLVYGPPESNRVQQLSENYVTSTVVPLRAYYNDQNYQDILSQIQYSRQKAPANTHIRPEYYSPKQNGKSVASFYFYEEPVKQVPSTPAPQAYYDGRNYYQSVDENGQVIRDDYLYSSGNQGSFVASNSNLDYRPSPSREPSPFFYVPQRQGSRTLTEEYFSINQNNKAQNSYVPQQQSLPQQQSVQSSYVPQTVQNAYVSQTQQQSAQNTYVPQAQQQSAQNTYVPQTQQQSVQNTYVPQALPQQQQQQVQNSYVPQQQSLSQLSQRPGSFYDQIASIQQTIDYYTTHRPKVKLYQPNPYREVRQKIKPTPRPVYQFNYQNQNNNPRPEQNTFRAPKMDDTEPFRPMVSYSKPYTYENEYPTTPQSTILSESPRVSTESPLPSQYYTTAKPEDYDYEDGSVKQTVERVTNRPSVFTPAPVKSQKLRSHGPTTKNPVNHAYYTKQEESLFDDITKNYFTIFGQKIENGNRDNQGLGVTAPLRSIEVSTIKTPLNNGINIQYANDDEANNYRSEPKPISLAGDTEVNYRQPRPLVNPESEFIPIVNPQIQAKYEAEQQIKQIREQLYHKQRSQQNVEVIKSEQLQPVREGHQFARDQLDYYRPLSGQQTLTKVSGAYNQRQVAEGRPGSLVAYRLPGEGAHVYFLTPQPARPENYKYRTAEEISALS